MNNRFRNAKKIMKRMGLVATALACAFFAMALGQAPAASTSSDQSQEPLRFNDVLGELLNEFSYELKTSMNLGVNLLSIRRVSLSENIPKTYEPYLESLTVEKIRKHSNYKVILCTKCKVKKTVVHKGRLTVTTPINDSQELDLMAKQLGINAWMDISLIFQETTLVLAIHIFDSQTKELLWTKVFNSDDMLRKKATNAGNANSDPSAVKADGSPAANPTPAPSKSGGVVGLGYSLIPNVKNRSGMLSLNLRLYEKFQEGRSIVGAQVMVVADPSLVIKDYDGVDGDPAQSGELKTDDGTTQSIKPFKLAVSAMALYGYNFRESPEFLDDIRYGVTFGLGLIASKGYLSFMSSLGFNIKLGRRFFVDVAGSYGAPTTLRIQKKYSYKTKGGAGGVFTFGFLF